VTFARLELQGGAGGRKRKALKSKKKKGSGRNPRRTDGKSGLRGVPRGETEGRKLVSHKGGETEGRKMN